MLPFSRPYCYFKTRPPSCALGTSFYTVSEGRDLMTYISDNYTSYSAPSPLSVLKQNILKYLLCTYLLLLKSIVFVFVLKHTQYLLVLQSTFEVL